jgi:Flp pilus assembly protein TadG
MRLRRHDLRRRRDEHGVVAIVVALCVVLLLVAAAMVIDFGLVRVDRQIDKSAADSATAAGLHGLNAGDGNPHPFIGVCTALRYLQSNNDRFGGLSDTAGTWTTGTGTGASNGCTDPTVRGQICTPGSQASWARFEWTGSLAGKPINVTIQSGYQLSSASGWSEDTLAASTADENDKAQGCDQLVVWISESRHPGLGSLATDSDLKTAIRSVGRVQPGPGGYAPAMLLLKRTGCPVLQVGATGGGANSYVHVFGALGSNGLSQPGTIHADTDGSGCSGGGGNWVFYGKAADGIVTYAAPTFGAPLVADPSKPGSMTSVAGANGVGFGIVRDASSSVYGSAALGPAGAGAAAKFEPTGRSLITRKPVDDRYFAGVKAVINAAQSNVFGNVTAANAVSKGYVKVSCTGPGNVATVPAYDPAKVGLFVDCATLKVMPSSAWHTVVFSGNVAPSATLALPNADHVYIFGGGDALNLGSGNEFRMHTNGTTDLAGKCKSTQTVGKKAVLVIADGDIKQSGGVLQLCNTSVILMGGQTNGCVPITSGTAPTQAPCGGMGTGQMKQTGGDVDWTAPDEYDVMTLPNGDPDPAKAPAWSDPNGPEDLALWSESAANSTSTKASMGGGAVLHVRGVFMVPNFDPFTIGGSGTQNLVNAQYIATSIALNGTVQLVMSVDPNSGVTLPKLYVVGLVR